MKRVTKAQRKVAKIRQEDAARCAREARWAKKKPYTEEHLITDKDYSARQSHKWEHPPAPLKKGADRLDIAMHELDALNWKRRQQGLEPLSYGRWTAEEYACRVADEKRKEERRAQNAQAAGEQTENEQKETRQETAGKISTN